LSNRTCQVDSTENTNKDIEEKTTEKETRTEKRAMNKKELASTIEMLKKLPSWVHAKRRR